MATDVIANYAEISLLTRSHDEQCERVLQLFFQHSVCQVQFYCRALLVQASLESRKVAAQGLKAEENLAQTLKSWEKIEKALEIITSP